VLRQQIEQYNETVTRYHQHHQHQYHHHHHLQHQHHVGVEEQWRHDELMDVGATTRLHGGQSTSVVCSAGEPPTDIVHALLDISAASTTVPSHSPLH